MASHPRPPSRRWCPREPPPPPAMMVQPLFGASGGALNSFSQNVSSKPPRGAGPQQQGDVCPPPRPQIPVPTPRPRPCSSFTADNSSRRDGAGGGGWMRLLLRLHQWLFPDGFLRRSIGRWGGGPFPPPLPPPLCRPPSVAPGAPRDDCGQRAGDAVPCHAGARRRLLRHCLQGPAVCPPRRCHRLPAVVLGSLGYRVRVVGRQRQHAEVLGSWSTWISEPSPFRPLRGQEGTAPAGFQSIPSRGVGGGGSYGVVVKHRPTLPNSRRSTLPPPNQHTFRGHTGTFIRSRLREGRFERWNHFHSKPKVLI